MKEMLKVIHNWLTFVAPNQQCLEKAEKVRLPLYSLLLQNGYLMVTETMAALLKGWTFASPKRIHIVAELLHHCIHYNVGFRKAVPHSSLAWFQKPKEFYPLPTSSEPSFCLLKNQATTLSYLYFKGFFEFWTDKAKGEALAMTECKWALYLAKAAGGDTIKETYKFTASDMKYRKNLLNTACPGNWTLIQLSHLAFN
ncbi:hypothetical protein ARMGADRAFT_1038195 [Armillaria gallica]|uniref:Uncharacterized protein n=1 Tax=Armillaria gallica TaxID=47427 RepID=A0A2H3CJ24_ARMGA|nr:hypothetical protein ARMGADRAFT_1038195 [Armillaria gallica]